MQLLHMLAAAPNGGNIGPFVLLGMILVGIAGVAIRGALDSKKAAPASAAVPAAAAAVEPAAAQTPAPSAPGSAGKLKLHDVPPKTAAMLMAIVADHVGKPLNELRFTSIQEVK